MARAKVDDVRPMWPSVASARSGRLKAAVHMHSAFSDAPALSFEKEVGCGCPSTPWARPYMISRVITPAWAGLLLSILITYIPLLAAQAERLEGALQIGDESLGVSMVYTWPGDSTLQIELAITRKLEPVRTAVVRLTPTGGTLTTQGRAYPIPEAIATSWWRQLTDPAEAYPALGMHDENQSGAFHSPTVLLFAPGIPGKAEIQFSTRHRRHPEVRMIRLFSLEEWDNVFHANVALGLENVAYRRIL